MHPLDHLATLCKIAETPHLNLHEQIYIIESALDLETFGIGEVFIRLSRHPYLCHSARSALLYYTNRLSSAERVPVNQLLLANKGVPDDPTPMEKIWCDAFVLDRFTVLDLYRKGLQEQDILIILYLNQTFSSPIEDPIIWRLKNNWYTIILDKISLSRPGINVKPDSFFPSLKPGTKVPEPFQRPYEFYWLGLDKNTPLTDAEIALILKLNVLVTYQHLEVAEAMNRLTKSR